MSAPWSNMPSPEVNEGGGWYWRGYPTSTNKHYFRLHMFVP